MKKFLAGVLIVFLTLAIMTLPGQAQRRTQRNVVEFEALLFVTGLFYSVRWSIKLGGHDYKLAQQAWASVLFSYSLLGILFTLATPMRNPVALRATIVIVWVCAAFVGWKWRARLRRAEAKSTITAPGV